MNPFEELPQYELRHLIRDLEELGRIQDIHLILSLETDNQKNAWFDIKQNTNNENEVVADFSYALKLLIKKEDKDGKNDFPMEFRYTLMLSSLNSIYGNMPIPFIKELIKAIDWDISQLLNSESNLIGNTNLFELIPILHANDVKLLVSSEKLKNMEGHSNDCIIRLLEINDTKTARKLINTYKTHILLNTRIEYLLRRISNLQSDKCKTATFLRIVNYWRKSATTTSTIAEDYIDAGITLADSTDISLREIIINESFAVALSNFGRGIKKENTIKKILPFVKINSIAQINESIDRQNIFNEDDRNYLFCTMLAKLNTEEGYEAIKSLIRGKSRKYNNIDIVLHTEYGSLSVVDLVRCLPVNYQETAARSLMRKLNPFKLFSPFLSKVMEESIASNSNGYKQYLELTTFLPERDKDQIIDKAIALTSKRRIDLDALGCIFPIANESQKKEIISKAIQQVNIRKKEGRDDYYSLKKKDESFISFVSLIAAHITNKKDLEAIRLSFMISDEIEKDEVIANLLGKVAENDTDWDHLNSLPDILDNISDKDIKLSTISRLIPKAPLKYLPLLTNKIVSIQMDVLDSIVENFSSSGGDKSRLLCSVALRYTQLGDIDKSIEVLKSVDAVRGKGGSASGFDSIKLTYKFPDVVFFEFIKTLIKLSRNEIAIKLLLQRLPDSRAVKRFLGDHTEILLNGNEVMFAVMDYYAKKNIYDPETNSWLFDRLNELNSYRLEGVNEILNSLYNPDVVTIQEKKLSQSRNNPPSIQTQKVDEITKDVWRSKINLWARSNRSDTLNEFNKLIDSLAILNDPLAALNMIKAIIDIRRCWP